MNNTQEKELIHKLIYQVLIEIREEATLKDNKKILYLSDLVHNIPLLLLKAENEIDYDSILKKIADRAESRGMQSWLKNALSQL
jgi:hypothetical protein